MKGVRLLLAVLANTAILLCSLNAQAAELEASVDRTTLEDGDVVQLTLRFKGRNSEPPDTTPLKADFEVLGTSSSTQMSFINGKASSSMTWTVNLRPRRLGTLTIPALQLGGAYSQPITIRVGESSRTQGENPDLFLETEISPQSPYVQAQLLYTVRLYYAIRLQSGQLGEPRGEDLVLHRVGEDGRGSVTRNGRRYDFIERRYALFPQQSGKLNIEAPVFEGQMIDTSRNRRLLGNDSFFGRDPLSGLLGAIRAVRVRGEPREILVQPRPAGAQGKHWLPAESVELSGEWKPATSSMKVGEPVTLNLSVTALGLTGAQLPEVMPAPVDGFSVYPDRAEVATEFTEQGSARGTRVQKIAFIPRQAGAITIPDIELRWWNTQTNSEQIARLPGIALQVEASSAHTATDVTPATAVAAPAPAQQENAAAPPRGAADALHATPIWIGLSALLLIAWLVTIALWRRDHRRGGAARRAHTDTGHEQASSDRVARKQILHACANDDAAAARRALLAWGAIHWAGDPPRGLEQLAARIDHAGLAQALLALDRALYTDAGQWNADALRALLDELPKTKPVANAHASERANSLLPMHYAQTHSR